MRRSLLLTTIIGAVFCSFSIALAQTVQEDCKPKIGWIPLPSNKREVKLLEAKVVELETVLATRINDLEIALATLNALVAGNAQDILTNGFNVSTNAGAIAANTANISTNQGNISNNATAIAGNVANIANNASQISIIDTTVTNQGAAITALENSNVMDMEPYVSVGTDLSGLSAIHLTGINLYIKNGTNNTATGNGLGNLIVGYNELRGAGQDVRIGSHNIVIGQQNNYSSYGGLVAGYQNGIHNIYTSVLGGYYNQATGSYSTISGGRGNIAEGNYSSVSGGMNNRARGAYSSISGGHRNSAYANYSSILGGSFANTGDVSWDSALSVYVFGGDHTIGLYSTVSGGLRNVAGGNYSSVSGGNRNYAYGMYSSILGGYRNCTGDGTWDAALNTFVFGGDYYIGFNSTISGGQQNIASGDLSSVSGGQTNSAEGEWSIINGGVNNAVTVDGSNSTIAGGSGITVTTSDSYANPYHP